MSDKGELDIHMLVDVQLPEDFNTREFIANILAEPVGLVEYDRRDRHVLRMRYLWIPIITLLILLGMVILFIALK